jgi:hypothetical protein
LDRVQRLGACCSEMDHDKAQVSAVVSSPELFDSFEAMKGRDDFAQAVEQFSSMWPIFKVSESETAHSRRRRLRGSSFSSVSSSLSWAVARVGDPGVSVTRTPALVLSFQGESLTCRLGSAAPFDSRRLAGAIGNYCSERSCSRIRA